MSSSGQYAQYSDEDLVSLLAARDATALAVLSERHAGLAYSLALRILRDPGWAEETVQDVLMRLWNRPEMFDATRGDLRKWLLRVTHNAAVSGLRGRRGTARALNTGPEPLELMAMNGEDPSETAVKSLSAETVRSVLAELPPTQRQALELAYYEGLTQSEIAARTREPLGTVKTRIRLGLQKLKLALEHVGVTE